MAEELNKTPPGQIIPGYSSGNEIAEALNKAITAVQEVQGTGRYVRIPGGWEDIGEFDRGPMGPAGPPGPRGGIGPIGPVGAPGKSYSELLVLHYQVPVSGLVAINVKETADLRGKTYEMVPDSDSESSFLVFYNKELLIPETDWTIDLPNNSVVFNTTLTGEGNDILIVTTAFRETAAIDWVSFPDNALSEGVAGNISYSSGYLAIYDHKTRRWIYLAASEVSPL
jgi:hypothetical protein